MLKVRMLRKFCELIIFNAKWLLIPFYFKLIWTLIKLMYHFIFHGKLESEDLISTLEDVDIVMIANLVKMIITGSYNSFVSKLHGNVGENISSGTLKVKMATSLVGVTAIALLSKSVNVEQVSWEILYKLGFVHVIFLVSAISLQVVDYLHLKSEKHEIEVIPNTSAIEHSNDSSSAH